jgi:hypothetical protein
LRAGGERGEPRRGPFLFWHPVGVRERAASGTDGALTAACGAIFSGWGGGGGDDMSVASRNDQESVIDHVVSNPTAYISMILLAAYYIDV